jgi:hypothetical protein
MVLIESKISLINRISPLYFDAIQTSHASPNSKPKRDNLSRSGHRGHVDDFSVGSCFAPAMVAAGILDHFAIELNRPFTRAAPVRRKPVRGGPLRSSGGRPGRRSRTLAAPATTSRRAPCGRIVPPSPHAA